MSPVTLKIFLNDGSYLERARVLDFYTSDGFVHFTIEDGKSASFSLTSVKYWELV